MPSKKQVVIIGTGLIGASLGQSLLRSRRYSVWGMGRSLQTLKTAIRVRAIERICAIDELNCADIIVLATPLEAIAPVLGLIQPHLKDGVILTDVGSVKGSVLRAVAKQRLSQKIYFVGAHPLAGSHETGPQAARHDLFKGSTCVLMNSALPSARRVIEQMWRTAGARTVLMSAGEHDHAVALVSHLPHLMAYSLMSVFSKGSQPRTWTPLLAGSFRDATRVSLADPDQWLQIFKANQNALRQAAQRFKAEANRLEKLISRPSDLRRVLLAAQRHRQKLISYFNAKSKR